MVKMILICGLPDTVTNPSHTSYRAICSRTPTFNFFLTRGRTVSKTNEAFFRMKSCWNKPKILTLIKRFTVGQVTIIINRIK